VSEEEITRPFEEPIRKKNRDAFVEADQLLFKICEAGYMGRALEALKYLWRDIEWDQNH
jgi:hypothetical protein